MHMGGPDSCVPGSMPSEGSLLLSGLPDEVLQLINMRIWRTDRHAVATSSKQLLAAALRSLKAAHVLEQDQLLLPGAPQLSTYSQWLRVQSVSEASLHIRRKSNINQLDAETVLQPLLTCSWLVRLVVTDLQLTDISNLPWLRQLEVERCQNLSTVCNLPQLQRLTVQHCNQLSALLSLPALLHINMYQCAKVSALYSLPALTTVEATACASLASVSNVPRLQRLCWSGAGCEVSASDLTQLSGLQILNVSSIFNITNISGLTALQRLTLKRCAHLTAIKDLLSLSELSLEHCNQLAVIANLPALTMLHLSGAQQVTSISNLPSLHSLNVEPHSELNLISNLPSLSKLHICHNSKPLTLCNTPTLQMLTVNCSVTYIDHVPALRRLQLTGSVASPKDGPVTCLTTRHDLSRLQELNVYRSPLTSISGQPFLQVLNAGECAQLTSISGLPALHKLYTRCCSKLTSLKDLPQLHELYCAGCKQLSSVCALPQLRRLIAVKCSHLAAMRHLPQLEEMRLVDCKALQHIKDLPGLQKLELEFCTNVSTLHGLNALTTLVMVDNNALTLVGGLPMLKDVYLSKCCQLLRIKDLPQLKQLQLSHCNRLEPLENLPQVKVVKATTADQGSCLSIRALPSLAELHVCGYRLSDCLSDLPTLGSLTCNTPPPSIRSVTGLTSLVLNNAMTLHDVAGLSLLQKLTVRYCSQRLPFDGMQEPNDTCSLPSLRELELLTCGQLPSIRNFTALQKISFSRCPALHELTNLPNLCEVHVRDVDLTKFQLRLSNVPSVNIICSSKP